MRPQFAYRQANPHAALSGWLLLAIPLSGRLSYFIAGYHAALNAIALLLVPCAVASWILTTIRAIHNVDVWFWTIRSTYVNVVAGIIAIALCGIMLVASSEAVRHGPDVRDSTLYVAAAILYGGSLSWSYFHNWRQTNSAALALSLTILQTICTTLLFVVINLWLDRRSTVRFERERWLG